MLILTKLIDDYPSLGKIQTLYDAWINPILGISIDCESYNNPKLVLVPEDDDDSKDGDYPDNRTKSNQGNGLCLHPRTRSVLVVAEHDGDGGSNHTIRSRSGRGDG